MPGLLADNEEYLYAGPFAEPQPATPPSRRELPSHMFDTGGIGKGIFDTFVGEPLKAAQFYNEGLSGQKAFPRTAEGIFEAVMKSLDLGTPGITTASIKKPANTLFSMGGDGDGPKFLQPDYKTPTGADWDPAHPWKPPDEHYDEALAMVPELNQFRQDNIWRDSFNRVPMKNMNTPQSPHRLNVESPQYRSWAGQSAGNDLQFHATGEDFNSFDIDQTEFGIHSGSAGQAMDVAARTSDPRIIPLHVRQDNPLLLKDEGGWMPQQVMQQIRRDYPDTDMGLFLDDDAAFQDLLDKSVWEPQELRDFITQVGGHDTIKYRNRYEGKGKVKAAPGQTASDTDNWTMMLSQSGRLSDEEYLKAFPEASYATISLDPRDVKSAYNEGSFIGATPNMYYSKTGGPGLGLNGMFSPQEGSGPGGAPMQMKPFFMDQEDRDRMEDMFTLFDPRYDT